MTLDEARDLQRRLAFAATPFARSTRPRPIQVMPDTLTQIRLLLRRADELRTQGHETQRKLVEISCFPSDSTRRAVGHRA
jgi:hypothetical protein